MNFKLQLRWQVIFEELSDEKSGVLIKIIFEYAKTGKVDIQDEVLRVAFATIKADIDKEREKKEHISRVRSEAGRKGGINSGKSRSMISAADEKPGRQTVKRFKEPTVSEVSQYINEKGYKVDAEKFILYYQSNGWTIGKSGKPMRDWKAAVTLWQKNEKKPVSVSSSTKDYQSSFSRT